jgi:DNA (cytosine-5)-methyltransferase 1
MWFQMVTAPTVISTFAGCGGSSLGYKLAGYKELLAVEWDDKACATFAANFPDVPIYHGDIIDLTGAECMRLAGIERGQLDVFDGSPPCQGFSTAGKRNYTDPRNSLFKEYARLVDELQPRVFVFENVTGLIKGVMRRSYLTIVETLRACGYNVKGAVMNAMYFNVAQSRQRVIIIGVRNDLGVVPSHPSPQTKPTTCEEALIGLVIDEIERKTLLDAGSKYQMYKRWNEIPVGGALSDIQKSGGGYNCKRVDPTKPMCAVCKTAAVVSIGAVMHWSERRRFTLGEFKRFCSFPDDFAFHDWASGVAQMGNCVPPNFMRAIAEHIRTNILDKAAAIGAYSNNG